MGILIKNFNRNVTIGLLLIAVMILPVILMLMLSLKQVVLDSNSAVTNNLRILLLASKLRNIESRQRSERTVYVMSGNDSLLRNLTADAKDFNTAVSEIRSLWFDNAGLTKLNHIAQLYNTHNQAANQGVLMRQQGATIAAVDAYFKSLPAGKGNNTPYALDDLVHYAASKYDLQKNQNLRFAHQIIKHLGIVSGLAFILSLVITSLLLRMVRHKSLIDKANEQLSQKEKQLSKARKEVLEIVAHDLKSPLSAILLSIRIAKEGTAKNENIRIDKYLDIIFNAAQSMHHLINDLLDHSKIESGNVILSRQYVELNLLINTTVARFQPIAESSNLQLHEHVEARNWFILLDSGKVEQVLSNLIANAIKFSRPQGVINLSLKQNGNYAVFSITDTGDGMSPDQTAHVFERYWQARETAAKGTGLGLAISKGIIDAHGGKIWVETEQGKGSTFFVSLPLEAEEVEYQV